MLKIKDNVDLKELEKYGFENFILFCEYYKNVYEFLRIKHLNVNKETKEIYFEKLEIWQDSRESLDILYDLIQAGLVEKVGGVENESR